MIQTDLSDDSYDGYIISPLQQDMVANLIADTAKPVIALDTNIESDKVLSFVGTGNEAAAKLGAIAAVEAAKEAGWETIQCIEIAGVQGDSTNTARMNGYQAGIEEAGGEFLENEVQYAEATATKAVDAMNGIISRHPEGIAIICANNDDMAIAAAKAARDSGNENYANTIFLGFNGDRAACEAILNDELTMSVAQMAYEMGYMSVEAMVKARTARRSSRASTPAPRSLPRTTRRPVWIRWTSSWAPDNGSLDGYRSPADIRTAYRACVDFRIRSLLCERKQYDNPVSRSSCRYPQAF